MNLFRIEENIVNFNKNEVGVVVENYLETFKVKIGFFVEAKNFLEVDTDKIIYVV